MKYTINYIKAKIVRGFIRNDRGHWINLSSVASLFVHMNQVQCEYNFCDNIGIAPVDVIATFQSNEEAQEYLDDIFY